LHDPTDKGVRDPERRVCDHVEVAPREAEVGRVGFDDNDVAAELRAQVRRSAGMQLDRDHACAGLDEWARERAPTGPDIDDEIAGAEPRVSDEPLSPSGIELMPSPWCPWLGHGCGRPSRRSSSDRLPVLGRVSRRF
jgi:hypothetical protein